MKSREKIIADCFNAWITKNPIVFENSFAENAVYVESWGPAYRNKAEIMKWFTDWTIQHSVLQWDIKSFLHQDNICVCEWYFKCECNGNIEGFDGVSIIYFDESQKIVSLKEYQSKTPNYYPYG